jgi:hypothetical protein
MNVILRVLQVATLVVGGAVASAQTSLAAFTGGDVGEGLDLDGTFLYAVNVGGPAVGPIRDANFTTDSAPGVTINGVAATDWVNANYGASANDDALEVVMSSIRVAFYPAPMIITLANLSPGATYKIQLLSTENGDPKQRAFNVFVEGTEIAHEFSPQVFSGNTNNPTSGALITHTFVAQGTTAEVQLTGVGVDETTYEDRNPLITALTLEQLAEAPRPIPSLDPSALAVLAVLLAVTGWVALRFQNS